MLLAIEGGTKGFKGIIVLLELSKLFKSFGCYFKRIFFYYLTRLCNIVKKISSKMM